MRKGSVLLTLALTLIATAASAQADALRWAADSESGTPYIFQDPQNPAILTGFEKEVAEGLARQLGKEAVFVQNQWDGLIPGLDRGNYDVVLNGLEITEERKAEVNFSIPYYITYEQLTVRRSEDHIVTLADCRGKKVGTLKFSVAQKILEQAGGIEVVAYEAESQAFEDLVTGRIQAVLIDAPIALYRGEPNPQLKLVGPPVGRILYGVALRKTDSRLRDQIDSALGAMIKSGELHRIYDRYKLWNPMMADAFRDPRVGLELPTQFEHFLAGTNYSRTLSERLSLYWSFIPILAKGALTTLELSLVAMFIAVAFGLLLALMRLYGPKPISWIALLYIELIRGTPLLIQLFFIFYALPRVGVQLSPFIAAVLGLGLNYAAYEAETYRAGMLGVPKAQSEAGFALGMNRRQTVRHIVMPQALRIVLPPITNDFISLLKDSSLVSVITMVELTKIYGQLAATYYDFLGTGVLVAGFYLLLGLPFVRLARYIERRLANQYPAQTPSGKGRGIFFPTILINRK